MNVSYNPSIVKIYNKANSLVRFKDKNTVLKYSVYCNVSVVVVNSSVVEFAPGADPTIVSYKATSSLVRLKNGSFFFSCEKTHQLTATSELWL
jgi:hypothetical protein